MPPVEPTGEQVAEIAAGAGGEDDGPVVMLNLNRYRERARYGDGRDADGIGGREAYALYGAVAAATLARLGARILWHTQAGPTVIGGEGHDYDEVIAVWYPSRAAFLELATDAEVTEALVHRTAALEHATLICCESGAEPALAGVELP